MAATYQTEAETRTINRYGAGMRALAFVAVVLMLAGLVLVAVAPSSLTGLPFIVGVVLFWVVGVLARRQYPL